MPQLHPAPWFAVLTITWLVLLAVIVPKIIIFIFPNNVTPQSSESTKNPTWSWPWH
nr:ATP synthase F0 subunit 8 [Scophthalmus aquosus]